MKKLKSVFSIIVIIAFIALIYFLFRMANKGYDIDSAINRVQKLDIQIDCNTIDRVLVASVLTVKIRNRSSRTHSDVKIRIRGFDKNGRLVREKSTKFLRTLEPNDDMFKLVNMPRKVTRCECAFMSSN